MNRPISVIVPLYQGAPYIETTLASVRAQTLVPLEVVVVDDHSTDDGAARAARFLGVRVHRAHGRGPAAARQQALGLARGKRIAFLDQDDVWAPDHLSSLADTLDRHPEAAFVRAPDRHWQGDPGGLTSRLSGSLPEGWVDPWTHLPGCPVTTPSCVMVERHRLDAIGGWNPEVPVADLYTYLRLTVSQRMRTSGRYSVAYRESPNSNSGRLRRDPARLLAAQVESVRSALQAREAELGPDPMVRNRVEVMSRLLDLVSGDHEAVAAFEAALDASDCPLDIVLEHVRWLSASARDPLIVTRQLQRLRNRRLRRGLAAGLRAGDLLRHGWHRPTLWPILAWSFLDRARTRCFPN